MKRSLVTLNHLPNRIVRIGRENTHGRFISEGLGYLHDAIDMGQQIAQKGNGPVAPTPIILETSRRIDLEYTILKTSPSQQRRVKIVVMKDDEPSPNCALASQSPSANL